MMQKWMRKRKKFKYKIIRRWSQRRNTEKCSKRSTIMGMKLTSMEMRIMMMKMKTVKIQMHLTKLVSNIMITFSISKMLSELAFSRNLQVILEEHTQRVGKPKIEDGNNYIQQNDIVHQLRSLWQTICISTSQ